jgi:hypothetical protein
VWAVLEPRTPAASVTVNGRELAVPHPGAHLLISHERHSRGEFELSAGADVRCDAVCFTPGLAAD